MKDYSIAYFESSGVWTTINLPDMSTLTKAYQSFDAGLFLKHTLVNMSRKLSLFFQKRLNVLDLGRSKVQG